MKAEVSLFHVLFMEPQSSSKVPALPSLNPSCPTRFRSPGSGVSSQPESEDYLDQVCPSTIIWSSHQQQVVLENKQRSRLEGGFSWVFFYFFDETLFWFGFRWYPGFKSPLVSGFSFSHPHLFLFQFIAPPSFYIHGWQLLHLPPSNFPHCDQVLVMAWFCSLVFDVLLKYIWEPF